MNARRLLMAALLLLALSAASVLAVDKCQPDCSGHARGDKVEDPMNCRNYYICMADESPTNHPVTCETGHFDPEISSCVPGEDCTPKCEPVVCQVACTAPADLVANPAQCNAYYLCDAALNAVGPFQCPHDAPYFNGKHCVEDESQCCQRECTPYCYPEDVQIIDPTDCTKYYICVKEGTPEEVNHYSCPSGQNFDMASSNCKNGAPCVILCSDITSTAPSGSTSPSTGCMPSFTCPSSGNFPMCHSCQPGYFQCSSSGQSGVTATCPENKLFNTDPNYPYCVLSTNCPYSPSLY